VQPRKLPCQVRVADGFATAERHCGGQVAWGAAGGPCEGVARTPAQPAAGWPGLGADVRGAQADAGVGVQRQPAAVIAAGWGQPRVVVAGEGQVAGFEADFVAVCIGCGQGGSVGGIGAVAAGHLAVGGLGVAGRVDIPLQSGGELGHAGGWSSVGSPGGIDCMRRAQGSVSTGHGQQNRVLTISSHPGARWVLPRLETLGGVGRQQREPRGRRVQGRLWGALWPWLLPPASPPGEPGTAGPSWHCHPCALGHLAPQKGAQGHSHRHPASQHLQLLKPRVCRGHLCPSPGIPATPSHGCRTRGAGEVAPIPPPDWRAVAWS